MGATADACAFATYGFPLAVVRGINHEGSDLHVRLLGVGAAAGWVDPRALERKVARTLSGGERVLAVAPMTASALVFGRHRRVWAVLSSPPVGGFPANGPAVFSGSGTHPVYHNSDNFRVDFFDGRTGQWLMGDISHASGYSP